MGREMAPLIDGCVVLEDMISVLSISPSHVDLLPHHHSLCLGHLDWYIGTPRPLQPGLGVEELGLEGGKGHYNMDWY